MGKKRALEEEEKKRKEQEEQKKEEERRKKQEKEREREEKKARERERKEAEKRKKAKEKEEKQRLKEEKAKAQSPPRVPEYMGTLDYDDEETQSATEEKTLEELEAERDALLQQVRNPEPPLGDKMDVDTEFSKHATVNIIYIFYFEDFKH